MNNFTGLNFSILEIKEAFWEQFNESGELWFNYFGTPEANSKITEDYWNDFYSILKVKKNG